LPPFEDQRPDLGRGGALRLELGVDVLLRPVEDERPDRPLLGGIDRQRSA
jgi:hypothetical protein